MTVIVILAMIFALLALRLFAVLGRRTGHEQTRQLPTPADDRTIIAKPALPTQTETTGETAPQSDLQVASQAQSGLRALISQDRTFDVNQFLAGARSAYGMILEAYWSGDRTTLQRFCSMDVADAFSDAITAREEAGHKFENRLVRIEKAGISDLQIENGKARITVRFEADISAVTKDAQGAVIAGSLSDAISTVEVWTFSRDVRSQDPNWLLVETDED